MILDAIPAGCGARWAFGTVILAFVVVYNEASGPTVIFSAILAAIYGLVSAICKSEIRQLQMPYIRASNKFDFVCLFLALWMDLLAILGACGALARTLSTCLDALTGGLARIFILGRNSPPNEPWPDVLGVTAVFLVTGMFMLGLENTRAFSLLMTLGVLGTNGILTAVSTLKGTGEEWETDYIRPNGLYSFLLAAALSTFAYPSEMPNKQRWKRFQGPLLVLLVCVSSMLSAGCLSTLVHSKYDEIYTAVPIFSILDKVNYHQKLVPAAACLLLLATSGAFLELFTELFSIIVRLATSEWKILTKQISYESPDSGNPVLAIFIGGSLSAMFAFACPMENLTHILAASHLCGGLLRAFYLLYSPFRPKFMQQSCESSLSYSRLSTAATNQNSGSRRSLWNLSIPIQNTLKKSRSNKKLKSKKEVEKEWLLLGEPSSPCPVVRDRDVESSILSDGEPVTSDIEYAEKMDNSDSDTSTDIDAVVDEYKQKVKVTTAGPMEKSIRVPSVASWRLTIFAIIVILFGICLTIFGTFLNLPPAYITGFIGIFLVSVMMSFIPKYTSNAANVAPVISTLTLSLGFLLLAACLPESWPAILFWLVAGFVLAMRCDKWFCMCLDHPATHQIIPSVSGRSAAIRIPRPPKGLMIPGRVQGHR